MNPITLRGIRNRKLKRFCQAGKLKGRFCIELGGKDTHLRRIIQRKHMKVL
jgi:hypothetical protein